MKQARRNTGAARALMALTLGLAAGAAFAQAYPSKPIRIIAPYAAGGAADLMGRYMCEKFPQSMGQPCVVENRPGAGGIIGTRSGTSRRSRWSPPRR